MKGTEEDWKTWLNDIRKHAIKDLSEWEEGFVNSIEERMEEGRPLTDKQSSVLYRIWEENL